MEGCLKFVLWFMGLLLALIPLIIILAIAFYIFPPLGVVILIGGVLGFTASIIYHCRKLK